MSTESIITDDEQHSFYSSTEDQLRRWIDKLYLVENLLTSSEQTNLGDIILPLGARNGAVEVLDEMEQQLFEHQLEAKKLAGRVLERQLTILDPKRKNKKAGTMIAGH